MQQKYNLIFSFDPQEALQRERYTIRKNTEIMALKLRYRLLQVDFAINCGEHHPGSRSDIEIMTGEVAIHEAIIKKYLSESIIADAGPRFSDLPLNGQYWAIMATKGLRNVI